MNKMKIGISGHTGFIGSHVVDRLSREVDLTVITVDDNLFKDQTNLERTLSDCDCIVQCAGMNRGKEEEIYKTNLRLANNLVTALEKSRKKPHLIFASSILSTTDTAFGRSKRESCAIFEKWGKGSSSPVSLLTIPNVFGDRSRPFYNSVVATFCHQLARGETPKIIQDREVEFIFINELTEIIYNTIKQPPNSVTQVRIKGTKNIAVSQLLELLKEFRKSYFEQRILPALTEPFLVNLYNTFLTYLKYDDLEQSPKINSDQRGELFEIIKLAQGGQIFYSTTKPGIIRGNHYHARKIEKFCVINGSARIRLRRIGTKEIVEFKVNGQKPAFIDIPIFHTHHIENTGQTELKTLFWCNELFDPADPDTFYEEVYQS